MIKNIYIFMLGFMFSSIVWRLDSGNTADIIFPIVLAALSLVLVILESRQELKGKV